MFNYPDAPDADGGRTILAFLTLDGRHRCDAYLEKGIQEIPAIEWQDHPIDYEKNKIPLLLEAAQSNTLHGDRLTPNDKKQVARDIAATDPECRYTQDTLARKLGVSQQTVNTWISDIRARQKTNRNSMILKLSRLGWTQEKISEKAGINQQRISQITSNTSFGNIGNLLSQGRSMEYIAAHYQMDLALAHKHTKPGTTLAFLNADWRDFESTPADQENPDNAITIFDYHSLLSQTGWKTIFRIECPLSTERLTGNQVKQMQDRRILGTVGRTLLIAKKKIS